LSGSTCVFSTLCTHGTAIASASNFPRRPIRPRHPTSTSERPEISIQAPTSFKDSELRRLRHSQFVFASSQAAPPSAPWTTRFRPHECGANPPRPRTSCHNPRSLRMPSPTSGYQGIPDSSRGVLAELDDMKKSPLSEKREWDCRAAGAGAVGEFECEWNPNEKSSD
jgi:hypothetical protein